MSMQAIQVAVFIFVTSLIALLTFVKCRKAIRAEAEQGIESGTKDVFLAGGSLSWVFVAGSITLTNLSTDQLVGMNGNQMLLLAWWELAAVVGLVILAKVFVPIYYKYQCTTTTELLEKRYNNHHIRALIGFLFLLGNVFIFLPAILYGGSLFMKSMFGLDQISLMVLAVSFAVIGACYAVFGGLRAVAVSDTYSGVLLLGLGMLVVFLALNAINWDFSGIPKERLTLIGDNASEIPWHTLLTGMVFIQIFYWSTNQTITQRAMASPSVKEAQKGVLVAAAIRFLIVPPIIVLPGVVSYKLYGDVNDAAYGMIVADVLPLWLSGIFAAGIAAAVLTTFNSILNASSAIYICDVHEKYISKNSNIGKLNLLVTVVLVLIALAMVPVYATQESIINTVQRLYGLLSMPILSCFVVGLLFRNVDYRAAIFSVIFGVTLYAALFFYLLPEIHYIHKMFVTLISSVLMALLINRFAFENKVEFGWPETSNNNA